eukprot:1340603-Alexandrium_andersonii.AAC.1
MQLGVHKCSTAPMSAQHCSAATACLRPRQRTTGCEAPTLDTNKQFRQNAPRRDSAVLGLRA